MSESRRFDEFIYSAQTGSSTYQFIIGASLLVVGSLLMVLLWILGSLWVLPGVLLVLGCCLLGNSFFAARSEREMLEQLRVLENHEAKIVSTVKSMKRSGKNPIPYLLKMGLTDIRLRQMVLRQVRDSDSLG
ncbi:MAG: hypothetical protein ACYTFG_00965 [Planctomycetota bacterium]|jgi:uncharacterized protein (DUF58 family)